MTVIALHSDRYCLCRHTPDGVRSVQTGHGDPVVAVAAAQIHDRRAPCETELVLHIATDDTLIESLHQQPSPPGDHLVGMLALGEALAKPTPLPTGHPAQLLPRVPRITARRVVRATTLLLLGLGLWPVVDHAHEHWLRQRQQPAVQAEQHALQVKTNALERNRREIESLQATTVTLAGPRFNHAGLLHALAHRMLPGLMLTRVEAQAERFVIEGWHQSGGSEVSALLAALNANTKDWTVRTDAEPGDGQFRLTGEFRRP